MPNEKNVIAVKNLTKAFDGRVVLENISLTAEKGKTTVIPCEAGKLNQSASHAFLFFHQVFITYLHDRQVNNLHVMLY